MDTAYWFSYFSSIIHSTLKGRKSRRLQGFQWGGHRATEGNTVLEDTGLVLSCIWPLIFCACLYWIPLVSPSPHLRHKERSQTWPHPSMFIQTLTEFHLLWVFGKRQVMFLRYELTCRSHFLSTGHQCQLASDRMFYGTQGRNGKWNFKPCVVVTTVVTGRRPARVWFRVAHSETSLWGALLALFPHSGNGFYNTRTEMGKGGKKNWTGLWFWV